jgi:hypothetical protein
MGICRRKGEFSRRIEGYKFQRGRISPKHIFIISPCLANVDVSSSALSLEFKQPTSTCTHLSPDLPSDGLPPVPAPRQTVVRFKELMQIKVCLILKESK